MVSASPNLSIIHLRACGEHFVVIEYVFACSVKTIVVANNKTRATVKMVCSVILTVFIFFHLPIKSGGLHTV